MKNPRKNNASKKVRWNGKTYISLTVFCAKVSVMFDENITPWLARQIIRSETNYHGHKITIVKKRAKKPKVRKNPKVEIQPEPLVWNNTFFDDYKEMAEIMEVNKSVIKEALEKDIPFRSHYIDISL